MKISRPPFPRNLRKRSKPFWPASGTISAASAPSSPISITSGTTTSIIRKSRAVSSSAHGPSRFSINCATTANPRSSSRAISAIGRSRRSAPSPMGSIARSCSGGRTSNPPIAPSSGSAPSRWARWSRPAATRRSSSAEALQNGQHVAMLVDQYLGNGVEVTFFGRKTKANPTLARLVRQVECPIHGVRIIRLPNHRFRAELSEEVKPVRDADGPDRRPGHDAGGDVCHRRLGARISGPVAVAAPKVAVATAVIPGDAKHRLRCAIAHLRSRDSRCAIAHLVGHRTIPE